MRRYTLLGYIATPALSTASAASSAAGSQGVPSASNTRMMRAATSTSKSSKKVCTLRGRVPGSAAAILRATRHAQNRRTNMAPMPTRNAMGSPPAISCGEGAPGGMRMGRGDAVAPARGGKGGGCAGARGLPGVHTAAARAGSSARAAWGGGVHAPHAGPRCAALTFVHSTRVPHGYHFQCAWLPGALSWFSSQCTEKVSTRRQKLVHARMAFRPARKQLIQALRWGA